MTSDVFGRNLTFCNWINLIYELIVKIGKKVIFTIYVKLIIIIFVIHIMKMEVLIYMLKKLILGATTVGLSLGIAANANAEEPIETNLPHQGNTVISIDLPITTFSNQIYERVFELYPKSQYQMAADTPKTKFVYKQLNNGNKYGGTLSKETTTIEHGGVNGDYWKVWYSGMLSRYLD